MDREERLELFLFLLLLRHVHEDPCQPLDDLHPVRVLTDKSQDVNGPSKLGLQELGAGQKETVCFSGERSLFLGPESFQSCVGHFQNSVISQGEGVERFLRKSRNKEF